MTNLIISNLLPRPQFTLMSWLFSEERRALRARIALERETRRQIGQMSDHMLKDIGVYYDECSDRFTPRPLDTSTSL